MTNAAPKTPTPKTPTPKTPAPNSPASSAPAPAAPEAAQISPPPVSETAAKPEHGGPKGLEPTRYGDWERNGRCFDF